jgi:Flp pilus assembly protein TadD
MTNLNSQNENQPTLDSTPDSLLESAHDHLAAGNPQSAARDFRAIIDRDSDHIEAHHGLVRALRDSGSLEPAIAVALALTVLTPSDPLAHTALAISLQHAGHIPEAEAASNRARILEWKTILATESEPTSGTL